MSQVVEMRDFVPTDWDTYFRLSQEFYRSSAVIHTIPEENFRRTFEECVGGKNPYLRGITVTVDGETAGYALLSFTWSNEAGGVCVLLEEVFFSAIYRGRGLGGKLFAFVEEEYIASGKAKRLRLEVTAVNTKAIRLYERQGYERIDYVQMVKDSK